MPRPVCPERRWLDRGSEELDFGSSTSVHPRRSVESHPPRTPQESRGLCPSRGEIRAWPNAEPDATILNSARAHRHQLSKTHWKVAPNRSMHQPPIVAEPGNAQFSDPTQRRTSITWSLATTPRWSRPHNNHPRWSRKENSGPQGNHISGPGFSVECKTTKCLDAYAHNQSLMPEGSELDKAIEHRVFLRTHLSHQENGRPI